MKYLKLFEEWNINESLASARKMYLNTNLVSQDVFDQIKDLDPSKNFKYLEKMIQMYLKDSPSIRELGRVFKEFDDLSKRNQISNTDINSYKSFKDIKNVSSSSLSTYKEKQELKSKSGDSDVVYEDDNVLVIIPRTHEATCKYGAGTKWCVTERSPRHYSDYKRALITHYFVIMKNLDESHPNYKMAVNVDENGKISECNNSKNSIITIKEVLKVSGLNKSLFVSNPTPLTINDRFIMAFQDENEKEALDAIKNGADVYLIDERGYSPLHWAAADNLLELCKVLLEKGVDINIISKDGYSRTPLHIASGMGSFESFKFLLDSGASIELKDSEGIDVLHRAVMNNKTNILELLLKNGANANGAFPDSNGYYKENTLLHIAAIKNYAEAANVLIQYNADIEAKNKTGKTPLHSASEKNSLEVAKVLCDNGSNPNAEDNTKWTPLHWAAMENSLNVAELLIKSGGSLNAEDSYQLTPIDLAKSSEMEALMKKTELVV